ncbi:MAG: hypothetical protein DRI24_09500 [Deltaproteobacteria bacterium]|nr:MAG: hypothetical protein DRI24_09500 [Deltaproteobacteria bacterium]
MKHTFTSNFKPGDMFWTTSCVQDPKNNYGYTVKIEGPFWVQEIRVTEVTSKVSYLLSDGFSLSEELLSIKLEKKEMFTSLEEVELDIKEKLTLIQKDLDT